MGEVYRALDTNLGRQVAIKVLPDDFVHDPERLARFEREARTLAALNHPNIAQIYGLEKTGRASALVMEMVEGSTLADLIARGPVPVDEALPVVRQIVEALEAAHERGIVHRDLKPANIKLRPDGSVKVLDFGLAKAMEPTGIEAMTSPTITSPAYMTGAGVLLGTAAYMAPEQARGKAADLRSDIWAFGCVLYEMLAGKQAFAGETVSDLLASVLRADPDWKALPPTVPATVLSVLRNCLQKDPRERWHSVADLRIQLKELPGGPVASARPSSRNRLLWAAVAVLAIAFVAALVAGKRRSAESPALWLAIPPPPFGFDGHPEPAVSRDGTQVAFVAPGPDHPRMLWIRSLQSQTSRLLPGTQDASFPFWSPDGRSVGFFAERLLKTTALTGGSPQALAAAPRARGGSWNQDDVIVFTPVTGGPIFRITASGGSLTAVTTVDLAQGDSRNDFPHFLPDGRHFLYFLLSRDDQRTGIYVQDLDGGPQSARVMPLVSRATLAGEFLLFIRDRNLFAQRFDLASSRVIGTAVRIAEGIGWSGSSVSDYAFDSSDTGVIAYWTGLRFPTTRLQWFDREGRPLSSIGTPAIDISLALSLDGERIAVERLDPKKITFDIWTIESSSGFASRMTSEGRWAGTPFFARNGDVFFSMLTDTVPFRVVKRGNESPRKLPGGPLTPSWLSDVSSDGRYALLTQVAPETLSDVWLLDMSKSSELQSLLRSGFSETSSSFSRDMKRIVYSSDKTGRPEIYVNSFPALDNELPLSESGGMLPRWSRHGNEIVFMSTDRRTLLAVDMSGSKPGAPRVLFELPKLSTDVSVAGTRSPYAVTEDGQRFLMLVAVDEPVPPSLVVGVNWQTAR